MNNDRKYFSDHGHGVSIYINAKKKYAEANIPNPASISNVPPTIGIHFLLKVHLDTSVVVVSLILNAQGNTNTNSQKVNRKMSKRGWHPFGIPEHNRPNAGVFVNG